LEQQQINISSAGGNQPQSIGVGMLGYAFMGKAHTNAFKKLPYMMYPPPMIPNLVAICGRNKEAVAEAAARYGYQGYYTDWRKMLENDAVELFDNGGPNDVHAAPCIMAASTSCAKNPWPARQKKPGRCLTR
jgi:predicted dehydrogenase